MTYLLQCFVTCEGNYVILWPNVKTAYSVRANSYVACALSKTCTLIKRYVPSEGHFMIFCNSIFKFLLNYPWRSISICPSATRTNEREDGWQQTSWLLEWILDLPSIYIATDCVPKDPLRSWNYVKIIRKKKSLSHHWPNYVACKLEKQPPRGDYCTKKSFSEALGKFGKEYSLERDFSNAESAT